MVTCSRGPCGRNLNYSSPRVPARVTSAGIHKVSTIPLSAIFVWAGGSLLLWGLETFSQPELVGEFELGGFSRLFSGLWIEKETAEEYATESWEESEDYYEEICSTSG